MRKKWCNRMKQTAIIDGKQAADLGERAREAWEIEKENKGGRQSN